MASMAAGWITIKRTQPDETSTSEYAKTCTELAPGVNYCAEIGRKNEHILVDVRSTYVPEQCIRKVKTDSQLLLVFTGDAGPSADGPWQRFITQEDFTVAEALKLNSGQSLEGFNLGIEGLCEGTKATITFSPQVGFDDPQTKMARPANVLEGSTLRYHVEVVKVLKVAPDGVPYRPCFFSLIDVDGSEDIDEVELARHFARIKRPMPPSVMNEDKDEDGRISFDEFSGPKIPRAAREAQDQEDMLATSGTKSEL
eukprot:CAMPEP_0174701360 /NCGR_PEP_ID=MMETSP1094-20130205/6024_1 /TAXON_ID=156173 /ORGANISM="Chrysochromulina brevifilum, Strain UTEX LB 985" /LENGTH=254 /DNA_ID=CAMNT_0015898989 /DNA_START=48 /DNA_END=812 /DNA_ORIENTATION=+